jgi:hypothetical protein
MDGVVVKSHIVAEIPPIDLAGRIENVVVNIHVLVEEIDVEINGTSGKQVVRDLAPVCSVTDVVICQIHIPCFRRAHNDLIIRKIKS